MNDKNIKIDLVDEADKTAEPGQEVPRKGIGIDLSPGGYADRGRCAGRPADRTGQPAHQADHRQIQG